MMFTMFQKPCNPLIFILMTSMDMSSAWCKSPAHVGSVASSPFKGMPPPSPALTRRVLRSERVLTQAPLQGQRSASSGVPQESTQPKVRCVTVDKEALLVQNAEIIASNAKLLSTIALYEKRYSDLLADRERTYQALAELQRRNSQLQGERDALAVALPGLLKQCVATLSAGSTTADVPPPQDAPEVAAVPVSGTDAVAVVQTTPIISPDEEVPEPPRKTHQKKRKTPPTPKPRAKKATARGSKASSRVHPTDVCCMRL